MKIMMATYGVGYKSVIPPKDTIILKLDNYRLDYRERTEAELEIEKKEWDSIPHLLSGEGYINRIRHEKVAFLNPNFPQNILSEIEKIQKEGLFDKILLFSDKTLANAIIEKGYDFSYLYPGNRNTAIGQMMIDKELPVNAISFYSEHWDGFVKSWETYPNAIAINSTLEKEFEKEKTEELDDEFERD